MLMFKYTVYLILLMNIGNINQAKFALFCSQRFGNRFGGAEGTAPFKALAQLVFWTFFEQIFALNTFWIKHKNLSGFETGCKPVLFLREH